MNDNFMSPEEMAQFKELQEKYKNLKKNLVNIKSNLFTALTRDFASIFSNLKKDVVTVSLKEPYEDGNIYAVTLGIEEKIEEGKEEIDTQALITKLLNDNLSTIETSMGVSNSLRVNGKIGDKDVYWQIRKRTA